VDYTIPENHLNQLDAKKLKETDTKLQALRVRLEAGENSPLINNFDGEKFIIAMHHKYISLEKL
jgi:hypothetical protein